MFYVYIIRSKKNGKKYTGFTNNLRKRFKAHNNNEVFSTKGRGPFELIYYEACINKGDAIAREKYLKSGMGKRYIANRLKRSLSLTGFTMIELLIAVLIFSIIASVVYSVFSTGTSVWRRTKDATQISMTINSVLEDLAKELRAAVKYAGKDASLEFTGEKDKIYFCSLSDTVTDEGQYKEIYRISYYADSGEETETLDLFKRKASLIKGGFEIDDTEERVLVTSLDDFKIEYAYRDSMGEVAWSEEWKNPDEIARALRIEIHKSEIALTKYISIPTGKLTELETAE